MKLGNYYRVLNFKASCIRFVRITNMFSIIKQTLLNHTENY